jgi:hypothetical protein
MVGTPSSAASPHSRTATTNGFSSLSEETFWECQNALMGSFLKMYLVVFIQRNIFISGEKREIPSANTIILSSSSQPEEGQPTSLTETSSKKNS